MATKELRKVKEVNGWKINHPHSAANIVFATFTFIFAAFPLAFLFVPLIANSPMLNGVDIFHFFIDFLRGMGTGAAPASGNYIIDNTVDIIGTNLGQQLGMTTYYMFVAIGGVLAIMMLFSVIKLILSIIHFGKGYLKRPGAICGLAITEFILTVLVACAFLYFYFAFSTATAKADPSGQPSYLVIWFVFVPVAVSLFFLIFLCVMRGVHFKDTILEKDLELHNGEPTVEHIAKVHEVEKTSYRQSATLPPHLESIGGHAFAENQNLVVANIPLKVTKLGPGAFANCLKLQVVSIPTSVKEIGFNCFFNCVELERINYGGTKDQWKRVVRGSNWLAKAKTTQVVCADGPVVVNPYH